MPLTFNGLTILPMPTVPAVPRTIEWQATDVTGVATNPFTLQQQVYLWGASLLEASLGYQPLTNAQAVAWIAWLMSLQGTAGAFFFGDPLNRTPQNPAASAPFVAGAGQTGYLLNVSGGSGQTVGDWIQIGFRLYRLTSVTVNQLGIWPQLRESPTDRTPIIINNTQGLFRLKSNQRKWSVRETKMYGLSFEIREAI